MFICWLKTKIVSDRSRSIIVFEIFLIYLFALIRNIFLYGYNPHVQFLFTTCASFIYVFISIYLSVYFYLFYFSYSFSPFPFSPPYFPFTSSRLLQTLFFQCKGAIKHFSFSAVVLPQRVWLKLRWMLLLASLVWLKPIQNYFVMVS